ncbi:uncharacterized protein TOT_020001063 [Theileria orientalis strain Shintoku]|uniref:Cyclic nucleotide-binding domain-containing protein n=1 Tax=Theileria orientalis strain Shintoku TaxID=869250 RepID=J4D7J9_THEOR|nr:uncharacterized protein TOT_020001063 [Theileria orientalis strain Shintoku]BAM40230.1 uncharacterized protein TOT_020001063 [Theileria orientalis strain Shintoku]|eukprot:XP_009690531.1 uncharacterized protein TOT_020001063 [Theileria orientalis strain Shintoku]
MVTKDNKGLVLPLRVEYEVIDDFKKSLAKRPWEYLEEGNYEKYLKVSEKKKDVSAHRKELIGVYTEILSLLKDRQNHINLQFVDPKFDLVKHDFKCICKNTLKFKYTLDLEEPVEEGLNKQKTTKLKEVTGHEIDVEVRELELEGIDGSDKHEKTVIVSSRADSEINNEPKDPVVEKYFETSISRTGTKIERTGTTLMKRKSTFDVTDDVKSYDKQSDGTSEPVYKASASRNYETGKKEESPKIEPDLSKKMTYNSEYLMQLPSLDIETLHANKQQPGGMKRPKKGGDKKRNKGSKDDGEGKGRREPMKAVSGSGERSEKPRQIIGEKMDKKPSGGKPRFNTLEQAIVDDKISHQQAEMKNDLMHLLETVPVFSDLPKSRLVEISKHFKLRSYFTNSSIILAGEFPQEFVIVASGTVSSYKYESNALFNVYQRSYLCSDYFGEQFLMNGTASDEFFIADSHVTVQTMNANTFKTLLSDLFDSFRYRLKEFTNYGACRVNTIAVPSRFFTNVEIDKFASNEGVVKAHRAISSGLVEFLAKYPFLAGFKNLEKLSRRFSYHEYLQKEILEGLGKKENLFLVYRGVVSLQVYEEELNSQLELVAFPPGSYFLTCKFHSEVVSSLMERVSFVAKEKLVLLCLEHKHVVKYLRGSVDQMVLYLENLYKSKYLKLEKGNISEGGTSSVKSSEKYFNDDTSSIQSSRDDASGQVNDEGSTLYSRDSNTAYSKDSSGGVQSKQDTSSSKNDTATQHSKQDSESLNAITSSVQDDEEDEDVHDVDSQELRTAVDGEKEQMVVKYGTFEEKTGQKDLELSLEGERDSDEAQKDYSRGSTLKDARLATRSFEKQPVSTGSFRSSLQESLESSKVESFKSSHFDSYESRRLDTLKSLHMDSLKSSRPGSSKFSDFGERIVSRRSMEDPAEVSIKSSVHGQLDSARSSEFERIVSRRSMEDPAEVSIKSSSRTDLESSRQSDFGARIVSRRSFEEPADVSIQSSSRTDLESSRQSDFGARIVSRRSSVHSQLDSARSSEFERIVSRRSMEDPAEVSIKSSSRTDLNSSLDSVRTLSSSQLRELQSSLSSSQQYSPGDEGKSSLASGVRQESLGKSLSNKTLPDRESFDKYTFGNASVDKSSIKDPEVYDQFIKKITQDYEMIRKNTLLASHMNISDTEISSRSQKSHNVSESKQATEPSGPEELNKQSTGVEESVPKGGAHEDGLPQQQSSFMDSVRGQSSSLKESSNFGKDSKDSDVSSVASDVRFIFNLDKLKGSNDQQRSGEDGTGVGEEHEGEEKPDSSRVMGNDNFVDIRSLAQGSKVGRAGANVGGSTAHSAGSQGVSKEFGKVPSNALNDDNLASSILYKERTQMSDRVVHRQTSSSYLITSRTLNDSNHVKSSLASQSRKSSIESIISKSYPGVEESIKSVLETMRTRSLTGESGKSMGEVRADRFPGDGSLDDDAVSEHPTGSEGAGALSREASGVVEDRQDENIDKSPSLDFAEVPNLTKIISRVHSLYVSPELASRSVSGSKFSSIEEVYVQLDKIEKMYPGKSPIMSISPKSSVDKHKSKELDRKSTESSYVKSDSKERIKVDSVEDGSVQLEKMRRDSEVQSDFGKLHTRLSYSSLNGLTNLYDSEQNRDDSLNTNETRDAYSSYVVGPNNEKGDVKEGVTATDQTDDSKQHTAGDLEDGEVKSPLSLDSIVDSLSERLSMENLKQSLSINSFTSDLSMKTLTRDLSIENLTRGISMDTLSEHLSLENITRELSNIGSSISSQLSEAFSSKSSENNEAEEEKQDVENENEGFSLKQTSKLIITSIFDNIPLYKDKEKKDGGESSQKESELSEKEYDLKNVKDVKKEVDELLSEKNVFIDKYKLLSRISFDSSPVTLTSCTDKESGGMDKSSVASSHKKSSLRSDETTSSRSDMEEGVKTGAGGDERSALNTPVMGTDKMETESSLSSVKQEPLLITSGSSRLTSESAPLTSDNTVLTSDNEDKFSLATTEKEEKDSLEGSEKTNTVAGMEKDSLTSSEGGNTLASSEKDERESVSSSERQGFDTSERESDRGIDRLSESQTEKEFNTEKDTNTEKESITDKTLDGSLSNEDGNSVVSLTSENTYTSRKTSSVSSRTSSMESFNTKTSSMTPSGDGLESRNSSLESRSSRAGDSDHSRQGEGNEGSRAGSVDNNLESSEQNEEGSDYENGTEEDGYESNGNYESDNKYSDKHYGQHERDGDEYGYDLHHREQEYYGDHGDYGHHERLEKYDEEDDDFDEETVDSDEDEDYEYDEETILSIKNLLMSTLKNKYKSLGPSFVAMDYEKTGKVTREVFLGFIEKLGIGAIDHREQNLMFELLKEEGEEYITFSSFYSCSGESIVTVAELNQHLASIYGSSRLAFERFFAPLKKSTKCTKEDFGAMLSQAGIGEERAMRLFDQLDVCRTGSVTVFTMLKMIVGDWEEAEAREYEEKLNTNLSRLLTYLSPDSAEDFNSEFSRTLSSHFFDPGAEGALVTAAYEEFYIDRDLKFFDALAAILDEHKEFRGISLAQKRFVVSQFNIIDTSFGLYGSSDHYSSALESNLEQGEPHDVTLISSGEPDPPLVALLSGSLDMKFDGFTYPKTAALSSPCLANYEQLLACVDRYANYSFREGADDQAFAGCGYSISFRVGAGLNTVVGIMPMTSYLYNVLPLLEERRRKLPVILQFLRCVQSFSAYIAEELERIAGACTVRHYKLHETVARAGELPSHFYVVFDGSLSVSNDYNFELKCLSKTDLFFSYDIVNNKPSSFTLNANGNLVLLSWERNEFFRVFPRFAALVEADACNLGDPSNLTLQKAIDTRVSFAD